MSNTQKLAARFALCGAVLLLTAPLVRAQPPLGGVDTEAAAQPNAAPTENANPAAPTDTLMIDDFESGVSAWTLNDPFKVRDPAAGAVLVGVVPTQAANSYVRGSQGAALFTFKAASGSWASASRRVDGENWARVGAQQLAFYLSADETLRPNVVRGVDLILRAHGPDGDEVFRLPVNPATHQPKPILLNVQGWRQVVIPLRDFTSARGPLTPEAMRRLYLLQFSLAGTWDSRFFSLDDLQVRGTGTPLSDAAPPEPTPQTTAPAAQPSPPGQPTPDPNAATVAVDFLRTEGRIAASANISAGTSQNTSGDPDRAPLEDARFRQAISTLKVRFVRLDAGQLCDLTDSSAPAFDYTGLKTAANRVRALGALPLIALTNPPAWALDERGYAQFARGAALALNGRGLAGVARYWEISGGSVTFYNAALAALRQVNSDARVGGAGDSVQEDAALRALLGGASGLDFLSVSDYGAPPGEDDATAWAEARSAARLNTITTLLRGSRFGSAALYVTASNLRPAEDSSNPTGVRLTGLGGAAWWAAYLSSSSRFANQVFHENAAEPTAGLLTASASAYPAYYAMWMWNIYFPSGSMRARATSSRPEVVVTACNTPTAHNLLLVNTSSEPQTAQVGIRGFPVLRAARMHLLDSATSGVRFMNLPKSPYQRITLPPYAVATVQFIEGTRRQ